MTADTYRDCIDACNDCATACDHCAASCLAEENPKPMSRCIALDWDCAEVCRLAAAFMSRGSGRVRALCALCAELCGQCADECERHPMDHCRQCAAACRQCAEECRRMAA